MIPSGTFGALDPSVQAVRFAYSVQAMATTVRLALENSETRITPMEKSAAIAITVEVMEQMMNVVVDGAERMQKSLGIDAISMTEEDV